MANTSRINGFTPIGHIGASSWNGQCDVYHKASGGTTLTDDMAVGDPVVLTGTAGTAGIYKGIPTIALLTPGDADGASADEIPLGIVVGFKQDYSDLNRTFVDGTEEALVLVCSDPTTLFEVQANAAVPVTSISLNAVPIKTSNVNRTTGTSGWELDVATTNAMAATATFPFKVERYSGAPNNEINSLYNKLIVSFNHCVRKAGVLGA
jgi:hypothetical protein